MKASFLVFLLFLVFGSLVASAGAEILRSDEAVSVHLRPATDSPVLGELEPGARLRTPGANIVLGPEQEREGWRPIAFQAELRGFVHRRFLTKDLEVRPGASIYHERDASPEFLLTEVSRNDAVNVGRLSGDWADVRLNKTIPAFIRYRAPAVAEAAPAPASEEPEEDFAIRDEPARAEAVPSLGPVITTREAIPTDGSMRLFQGYLSQPRSFLGRQHPYPYQMVTERGNRIAYLDLSRLLITTPLENLMHYRFEFYGRAKQIEDRRDFVIEVENMRMR